MSQIFLPSRRNDSEATAGRIADHLADVFGRDALFQGVGSLRPGQNFRFTIERALEASDTVLVVIGRQWLTATSPDGTRRIDQPDDFVRREIEHALRSGKGVIPVLVDGAAMPGPDALPASIREIAFHQAVNVRPGGDFQSDGQRLIAARSTAPTTLTILGTELRTEHVGVALVGIGLIIAFLTVRSVLKSQHDLARLPLDR